MEHKSTQVGNHTGYGRFSDKTDLAGRGQAGDVCVVEAVNVASSAGNKNRGSGAEVETRDSDEGVAVGATGGRGDAVNNGSIVTEVNGRASLAGDGYSKRVEKALASRQLALDVGVVVCRGVHRARSGADCDSARRERGHSWAEVAASNGDCEAATEEKARTNQVSFSLSRCFESVRCLSSWCAAYPEFGALGGVTESTDGPK